MAEAPISRTSKGEGRWDTQTKSNPYVSREVQVLRQKLYRASHFVAPLTDMCTPLHAPSDWSAVFHFIAIYMFLLLTYAFSHSHETLTLPLLLP